MKRFNLSKNLLILIHILILLVMGFSFTGFKDNEVQAQPDPVITRNLFDKLPADDSKFIHAKLKSKKQMTPSKITELFHSNKIDLVELGWEWGDNKTHYPVDSGLTLADALAGLKEHQIKHLASLLNEMPIMYDKLLENGQEETAKNLERKIKDYENQLGYVKNNPINIAYFCMIGTVEKVKEIAMENNLVVDEFKLINLSKAVVKEKLETATNVDATKKVAGYQAEVFIISIFLVIGLFLIVLFGVRKK